MRILIISNYYPPLEIGGWEQLTQDVAQRLQARGHELLVLTSNVRAAEITQPELNVERALHLESPDHIHYHLHYTLLQPWRARQNRSCLAKAICRFRPDIIFINGMWNLSTSLAHQAEQLLPHRVVYYMASTWPTETDAHHAYWQMPPRRRWLQPLKWIGGEFARRLFLSEQREPVAFELVLCVSNYIRRHMVEQAGLQLAQTRVVHNGIDLKSFTMRDVATLREQTVQGPLRLLFAGRLIPDKGVHTVIEAVGKLMHQEHHLPVTLTILGSGSPDYIQRLKQCVSELGLEDIVVFRNQVPREHMPQILNDHDVLLLPSIWQEPLARMMQEAMACGLVVVGTTTGGTGEILRDGENGLSFQAGDAHMLAEKLKLIVADQELRTRLACAARKTVEAEFDIARMVDELEACFLQVLADSCSISIKAAATVNEPAY